MLSGLYCIQLLSHGPSQARVASQIMPAQYHAVTQSLLQDELSTRPPTTKQTTRQANRVFGTWQTRRHAFDVFPLIEEEADSAKPRIKRVPTA